MACANPLERTILKIHTDLPTLPVLVTAARLCDAMRPIVRPPIVVLPVSLIELSDSDNEILLDSDGEILGEFPL